ncbi:MAG: hypothetical protein WAQ28_08745 [Bacteroidia bacterium]
MKTLLQIFLLLIISTQTFAKCASSGLYFWPEKQDIHENSIFVIDGFATSQKIITGFGTTYKVYLKSNNQKVNLIVQETLKGEFQMTQAVLKPETALSAGQEYELIIENLGDMANQVSKYNSKTGKTEKIKWTVVAGRDQTASVWTNKPTFKSGSREEFGCGPAVSANFTYTATDNSEFLIKTTVKNKSTETETTYYLVPGENTIRVGHGMCSGAFKLEGSDTFEVEFSLMDASGNLTKWTGNWVEFKRP